jgi:acylphosphatase
MMSGIITKEMNISGRVQMVGFRWFTMQQAAMFHITGWVRNRPDGSVQILAQGEPETIEAFEMQVRKGPFHARVDHFESVPLQTDTIYQQFEIKG